VSEKLDRDAFKPGYGTGGVPWYLMVGYLSFLVFFTWYVLEHQLPDYLDQGPTPSEQAAQTTPGD
jgi:hypothetical protein